MKASSLIKTLSIFLLVASLSPAIKAQQPAAARRAGADMSNVLRIKKFVGVGRPTIIKTPVYTTSVARSVTREKEWASVWVQYETAPAWIDEIVFKYYVLARRVEKGKELFSLYRTSVKYIDVEKGRAHFSTVFLRPNAIKRYGDIVASAVEITVNGEPAAMKSEKSRNMPADWWKNPAVTESAAVTVRAGYLLNRSETPFANVNVDDYEVIK